MLDKEFLRYQLNKKNIKIADIAKAAGCTQQNINYKIAKNKLTIRDIFIILKLTNLKFEEVFKND
jgi:hypothetical protein